MFDICFMEFELGMQILEHNYETSMEKLSIYLEEAEMLEEQGYFEESVDDVFTEAGKNFLQIIKDFFKGLVEKIRKLIADIKYKHQINVAKKDINKRLKEFKKTLAANKAYAKGEKVSMFNTSRYVKEYTKYINMAVEETKKVFNKKYTSLEELEKAYTESDSRLVEMAKKMKFSDDELWTININLQEAVVITEKELADFNANINELVAAQEKLIQEQEKIAEACTNELEKASTIETGSNDTIGKKVDSFVAIAKRKIERVKTFASQMTSKLPPVVQKVLKSPITKVGILGVAIASIAHHSGYQKGSGEGFMKGYGSAVKDTMDYNNRNYTYHDRRYDL